MKKRWAAAGLAAIVSLVGLGVSAGCNEQEETEEYITAAIARESSSGTRSAFDELVKNTDGTSIETALATANLAGCVSETSSTAAVVTEIAGSKTTLGYISLGSVAANADKIKAVKVEGVEATTENIVSGSYVLSRPFNIIYQSEENLSEAAKDFLSYLMSEEGQSVVEEQGYIALTAVRTSYTAGEGISGTVNISGSTSVQPLMLKLAAAYMQLNSGVTVKVEGGGSGVGVSDALSGAVDFGMASRDLKSSETGVVAQKLADDGIAVIVHKDCALTNVTLDQLYNLYINGTKIKAE